MILDSFADKPEPKQEILDPVKSFEEVITLQEDEVPGYLDTLSIPDLRNLGVQCFDVDRKNVYMLQQSTRILIDIAEALQRKYK